MGRRGLVLALLTALKQVCNHPAQYLHERGPLPSRSGKLAALDELLGVILDEGEQTLVFSQYVEMCRLIESHLADRGVPTLFLHGQVPARRREEMVARFQAGGAPVFLRGRGRDEVLLGLRWTLDGEPSPEPATLVAGDVTR